MSKLLLHYQTTLGGRTVVVEVGDQVAASAILSAHQGTGEMACLVAEIPRYSLKQHMEWHKLRVAKLRRIIQRWRDRNAPKVVRLKTKARLHSVR